MTHELIISGDEFHARYLEQPAVIQNPFPYYDLLRYKPIKVDVEGYPPVTVKGMATHIPA